ncbi:c-type cytochrome [Magnetospirillum sp. 15-1]|uniref:c-type cytochrome n=1 Tax=Magnetospirillum sp. 15-1 TaxID=1979370 RepID=UPI001483274A|nr:c-type cytochrome [Magnetospirillum sp. 15-1]
MAAVVILFPWGAEAGEGKAIFDGACASCHFARRDPARRDEMVAPPIDMMSARIRQLSGNDRDAFLARVVDYVKAPSADKSADPNAIQRFGLMPAIGDTFPQLTDKDLVAVAAWMFDAHASVRLPPGGGGMGRQ